MEYQLSWFGKKYCADNDITFVDKKKAKKEFVAFLESYVESGEQIVERDENAPFRVRFTKLHDAAFGKWGPNKKRIYSTDVMNKSLKAKNINYKIVSYSKYWIVEKCDWEIEDSE